MDGVGDIDGDGIDEMLVSDHLYTSGKGVVFLLYLDSNAQVVDSFGITNGQGGFTGQPNIDFPFMRTGISSMKMFHNTYHSSLMPTPLTLVHI